MDERFLHQQNVERPRRKLTQELALENSREYVENLLRLTGEKTMYTMDAWEFISGLGEGYPTEVGVNTATWQGLSTPKVITVGSQPIPQSWKTDTIFEEQRFNTETEKCYIFSHEVAHGVVHSEGKDAFRDLGAMLKACREDTGKGFSGTGSQDYYRQQGGGNLQALEDLTELINMYLIDPEYLQRFLQFLQNPAYEDMRAAHKLMTLPDPKMATTLYSSVESGLHENVLKSW